MISWDLTYENIPLSYQQEAAEMSDLPEDPVLPQWTAHSGTFNSIIIFFPVISLHIADFSNFICKILLSWAECTLVSVAQMLFLYFLCISEK